MLLIEGANDASLLLHLMPHHLSRYPAHGENIAKTLSTRLGVHRNPPQNVVVVSQCGYEILQIPEFVSDACG